MQSAGRLFGRQRLDQRHHFVGLLLSRQSLQFDLAQFGLGEALLRVYSLLDGRTRLGDLAARVRSPEARLNLLRLTYLLVQTDFARLS